MIAYVLHSAQDADSREFLKTVPPAVPVYDWYDGGRELWQKRTWQISAFPSVVLELPALTMPGGQELPPRFHILTKPRDWSVVLERYQVLDTMAYYAEHDDPQAWVIWAELARGA